MLKDLALTSFSAVPPQSKKSDRVICIVTLYTILRQIPTTFKSVFLVKLGPVN